MKNVNIGIFGATGEVGQTILSVLDKVKFPVCDISLFAGRSAGKPIETPFGEKMVHRVDEANYHNLDIAFWAISGEWSKENRDLAEKSNCYIIDNSSAFRYDHDIPLIVPEVNGSLLESHPSRIIANPNCTTAIAAIPLHILNELSGIEKISFTTYQSASGAGNGGIAELQEQSGAYYKGTEIFPKKFAHQLANNIIPHIDVFGDNGYTKEEMKTNWETKKILGLVDTTRITSTCVRVPVERSHAEDLLVKTTKPVNLDAYRAALEAEPMVTLFDSPNENKYPMPVNTSGEYPISVGRIRNDEFFDNGLRMFVCGDQLLRGAGLNAVLIAQKLYDLGKFDTQ